MKDKYIEHDFPRYFVFGAHSNGNVDIADADDSTLATVSRVHAEKLITDRDRIVNKLCEMARAFESTDNEAFTKFWYGPNVKNEILDLIGKKVTGVQTSNYDVNESSSLVLTFDDGSELSIDEQYQEGSGPGWHKFSLRIKKPVKVIS